jgi:hypothetical protein
MLCTPHLSFLGGQIKNNIMGRTYDTMGERRGAYGVFVGNSVARRPLTRPRRGWENNIKMDLQEIGLGARTGSIWLRIGTGGWFL